jgi:hypothetical protein
MFVPLWPEAIAVMVDGMDAPTAPAWYLKLPPPVWTLAMLLCAWLLTRSFDWGRIVYFRSLPILLKNSEVAGAGLR